jgi:general secretion pathway protein J
MRIRSRARNRSRRRHAGFTILELLVAIALLAVLALLGWRGMASIISGRDSIVERSDELRALTVVMAQFDEDLRRAWPVRLMGLETPVIAFTRGTDREPAAIVLLRETQAEDPVPVRRVAWRLRDGLIERGFGDFTGDAILADSVFEGLVWQPLVGGVETLEFRGWLAGLGWQPAAALTAEALVGGRAARPQAGVGASAPIVTGVEMVMVRRGQRLIRVFQASD